MNDVADPAAPDPAPEVNLGALSHPAPPPEVDLSALRRPDPAPDVDAEALTRPPTIPPRVSRCRHVQVALVAVVAVALAGGGLWWRREVTANPYLEFYGGPNVSRDAAATDRTGISNREPPLTSEVEVAFVPNSRFFLYVGLYNNGRHDVRIEGAPPTRSYSWGFEAMAVAANPDSGGVGFAERYDQFHPFTLKRGDTRNVRLEFSMADCDPASLQVRAYNVLRSLNLRYRTLRISRTADVEFQSAPVALQAMGDCPDPRD
jgi:hypothetical protein